MKKRLKSPSQTLLIVLNLVALISALFWLYFQPDFEPMITTLVLISTLIGLFIAKSKKIPLSVVETNNSNPIILIVDDDLSSEDELFKQIKSVFSNVAQLSLISNPKKAIELLQTDSSIIGCITDIVFRSDSELAGVHIAETAIESDVPVVVITGHKKQNIGVALDELNRIGINESKILKKPITFGQYKKFLEQLKGWILGIG